MTQPPQTPLPRRPGPRPAPTQAPASALPPTRQPWPLPRRAAHGHSADLVTTRSADLVTPRCARAVAHTRAHIRDVLHTWQLPTSLVDDAALLVTELATNAVRHGTGPTLRVHVGHRNHLLRCQIHDNGPRPFGDRPPTGSTSSAETDSSPSSPPYPHEIDTLSEINTLRETGRGLALVDALAARWGTYTDPEFTNGSHIAWFEITCPPEPTPPSVPPAMPPSQSPPAPETDPAILRRVLDGLRRP